MDISAFSRFPILFTFCKELRKPKAMSLTLWLPSYVINCYKLAMDYNDQRVLENSQIPAENRALWFSWKLQGAGTGQNPSHKQALGFIFTLLP